MITEGLKEEIAVVDWKELKIGQEVYYLTNIVYAMPKVVKAPIIRISTGAEGTEINLNSRWVKPENIFLSFNKARQVIVNTHLQRAKEAENLKEEVQT